MVASPDESRHGLALGLTMDARMIKLLPLAAVLLTACSEDEVRTYRVASEESGATEAVSSTDRGTPQARSVRWHAPENWTEEPAGQFQLAAYELGSGLRATVSMLPGEAGGVAANVNRWRGQVGLEPIAESQISGTTVQGFQGEGDLRLYELLGTSGDSSASGILAGILRLPGETWFFKLSGPVALLAEKRPEFVRFLGGLETKAGNGGDHSEPAAGKADEPQKPKINFEIPDGWNKGEESAMRVASFRASGEDGYEADIAVVPLPGDAGSVLDNINRWRAQLQLEPLDNENDPAIGTLVDGPAGTYLLSHMKSAEPIFDEKFHGAISAAILKGGKYTWFLKISGEARVVEANQTRFEAFVRSARFP